MKEVYVEKIITFTYRDGRYDVALLSGEFKPDAKYYKLRIEVPADLIAGEVIGEVSEAAATKDR